MKTLFERMSEAQSMTDRTPTLEAMVEEMARAIDPDAFGVRRSSFDGQMVTALPSARDAARKRAQACASIAQKEIERVTAERDALRDALILTRNTVGDLRRGFARSVEPQRWVEQLQAAIDAALNERPAQ